MNDLTFSHIERWTMPPHYFGEEWPDYFSAGVGQSRDSDPLERANFEAMLARLGGESDTVIVVHESHWAVGWVEWIAIHESNLNALNIANDALASLEDYPSLDDDLYSEKENEDCEAVWEDCFSVRQRIAYLRSHGYTARRFRDLLAACRGSWYAASHILHCPSDLAYH